jgi:hypothetical protein
VPVRVRVPVAVRVGGATVDNGSRSKTYTWLLELQPYLDGEAVFRAADAALETAPGYQTPPHEHLAHVVKTYACPADPLAQSARSDGRFTAAYSSYAGVLGDRTGGTLRRGVMAGQSLERGYRPADIRDGLSQTLFAGEGPAFGRSLGGAWYTSDLPFDLIWTTFPWRHNVVMPVRDGSNPSCRGPMRFGPGRADNPCDSLHFWSHHGGGGHFALADGSVRWFSYTSADLLPALATIAGGEVSVFPD